MAKRNRASQGGGGRSPRAERVTGEVMPAGAKPLNPRHPLYRPGCDAAAVGLEALGKFVLRVRALERGEVRPVGYEVGDHEDAVAHPIDP